MIWVMKSVESLNASSLSDLFHWTPPLDTTAAVISLITISGLPHLINLKFSLDFQAILGSQPKLKNLVSTNRTITHEQSQL